MISDQQVGPWVGRTAQRKVQVTGDMIDEFARLSGDFSPIHVQEAAARERGFGSRVAHGMLLGSLVSSVIGMDLPGPDGVIQEVQLAFRKTCHPGDEITIDVRVADYFESVQTLLMKVKITRADGTVLATGKVQSGLRVRHD